MRRFGIAIVACEILHALGSQCAGQASPTPVNSMDTREYRQNLPRAARYPSGVKDSSRFPATRLVTYNVRQGRTRKP